MFMRIGKIPETVLKRSVLREIKSRRREVILGSEAFEDCCAIGFKENETVVVSSDPAALPVGDPIFFSIYTSVNNLAASGADPVGILLSILLPVDTDEAQLRSMMRQAGEVCEELGIQIIGGHTGVTEAVKIPVITVTGIGKTDENGLITVKGAEIGDDVVVTKWIGIEGTCMIAREKEAELNERFNPSFVRDAKDFSRFLSVAEDARIALKHEIHSMLDISEGGIFGALWELAEASKTGLFIQVHNIPIRQETIEICELYRINPYSLLSGGSLLIAAPNGSGIVSELKNEGIDATVIGKITKGKDRILKNGEDIRYIERPAGDEIYKVIAR